MATNHDPRCFQCGRPAYCSHVDLREKPFDETDDWITMEKASEPLAHCRDHHNFSVHYRIDGSAEVRPCGQSV